MSRDVYFFAGVYGVGKTTICNEVTSRTGIPSYSASDLISSQISENYGAQKSVTNKEKNQYALIAAINKMPPKEEKILLAGHFCIFNKQNEVEILPEFIFPLLGIKKIFLLITDADTIIKNLYNRDKVAYGIEAINEIMSHERSLAEKTSEKLQCKLYIHHMKFDGTDADNITKFLLKN